MKHLVMFSGGLGSWLAGKLVAEAEGTADLILMFTDTLIEDEDLYRFLREGAADIGGEFVYLAEGRTPWEVFHDSRFLGNSRVGICSRVLKRDFMRKHIESQYKPEECIIYLGIDAFEAHRFERAEQWWKPYTVQAPLCDPPHYTRRDAEDRLKLAGIEIPRLYKLGFAHNNCGGFCVRSGHGQFAHLLKTFPALYDHHEKKEEELRQYLDADVAIMRDRTGGKVRPLTMKEFRGRHEKNDKALDLFEWGGCGCFGPDKTDGGGDA